MEKRSLRDADVRQSLSEWLVCGHADPQTRVLHELKVPRPSARIDVALVNGELTSYEIKSDVDSLSRLGTQISACNRVFDKAYVVTTGRHVKRCMDKIPPWWGIVLACEDSRGVFVSEIRKSKANPERCIKSSLYILTKTELSDIFWNLYEHRPKHGLRHAQIVDLISRHCDPGLVRIQINNSLKLRGS